MLIFRTSVLLNRIAIGDIILNNCNQFLLMTSQNNQLLKRGGAVKVDKYPLDCLISVDEKEENKRGRILKP